MELKSFQIVCGNYPWNLDQLFPSHLDDIDDGKRMISCRLISKHKIRIIHFTMLDRKSVVQGKSVDLGGRRIIKKKNEKREVGRRRKENNKATQR